MDAKNIRIQKEEELKEIIERLSAIILKADKEIEQVLSELLSIYQGDYRHDYSIFFPILYELNANDSKGSIGTLSTNIQMLRTYIDDRFLDEVYGSYAPKYRQIIKLLDHLTLEGIRLENELSNEKKFEDAKKAIEKASDTIQKLEEATQELKRTRKKLDKATKKAKSMQDEFISLLSIFSAVVLLFAMDSNYIGSAITSISSSSIFKVVFVICLCGLVLVNGIYLLFNFIMFVIDRNSVNDSERRFRDKVIILKTKSGNRKEKLFNKNYYGVQSHLVRILNFVFCAILVLDFIAWILNKNNIFPFN